MRSYAAFGLPLHQVDTCRSARPSSGRSAVVQRFHSRRSRRRAYGPGRGAIEKVCDASGVDAGTTRLRLSIEGGGCSGFQYKFEMERETPDEDIDLVFPHETTGVELVVDDAFYRFRTGCKSRLCRRPHATRLRGGR